MGTREKERYGVTEKARRGWRIDRCPLNKPKTAKGGPNTGALDGPAKDEWGDSEGDISGLSCQAAFLAAYPYFRITWAEMSNGSN